MIFFGIDPFDLTFYLLLNISPVFKLVKFDMNVAVTKIIISWKETRYYVTLKQHISIN